MHEWYLHYNVHVHVHVHVMCIYTDITIYLHTCSQCGPRLSEAAADKLKNQYVMMRSEARQHEREISKKSSIPITVR